jgi:translation initiation factor 3 subunit M
MIKALQTAVSIPSIFDLQDLASLACIQHLQNEKDPAYDFLQFFLTGDLEAYRTFTKSHPTWLADNRISPRNLNNADIDESKAERKARLLTITSLANTPSRTLPYSKIVSALDVPMEDVELWLIDVIRAGLVEGKLSQARQELLVHRTTYRKFGRAEWEELDARLEDWKVALENVLASDQIAALKEQEAQQQPNGTANVAGKEVAT